MAIPSGIPNIYKRMMEERDADLLESMENYSKHLRTWNKKVFGDIFKLKARIQKRLECVQRKLSEHVSEALLKLERKLKPLWNDILHQEELYWYQKSRVKMVNVW